MPTVYPMSTLKGPQLPRKAILRAHTSNLGRIRSLAFFYGCIAAGVEFGGLRCFAVASQFRGVNASFVASRKP